MYNVLFYINDYLNEIYKFMVRALKINTGRGKEEVDRVQEVKFVVTEI